jgi:hypothetical protein
VQGPMSACKPASDVPLGCDCATPAVEGPRGEEQDPGVGAHAQLLLPVASWCAVTRPPTAKPQQHTLTLP